MTPGCRLSKPQSPMPAPSPDLFPYTHPRNHCRRRKPRSDDRPADLPAVALERYEENPYTTIIHHSHFHHSLLPAYQEFLPLSTRNSRKKPRQLRVASQLAVRHSSCCTLYVARSVSKGARTGAKCQFPQVAVFFNTLQVRWLQQYYPVGSGVAFRWSAP